MAYIDAVQQGGNVVVWSRDASHQLKTETVPAPFYLYHYDQSGPHRSIFGHPVKRLDFATWVEMRDFKESHSLIFESDISALNKYLSDAFYNLDGPVHKAYYDIEIDYDLDRGEGYPTFENPYGEINSISLFDVHQNIYHLIMLNQDKTLKIADEEEGLPVFNHHCVTEAQVLDTFIRIIQDVDVLTAWNGDKFDLPYILARLRHHYGSRADSMLCRDGIDLSTRTFIDDFDNETTRYELAGRVHLDMLELYKKFTYEQAPSFKLDNIAEKELQQSKRKYPGDLRSLYRNDPRRFFDYSLHDTRLLKQLDAKKKLLDLTIGMARQATVRFHDVMGSIKYLEHSIRNHCHHDRNGMLVLPDRSENHAREMFTGAFVLETKAGVYGWCQSVDLVSLYPSVIRALNISPETHRLQCRDGHNDFIKIVECRNATIEVVEVASGAVSIFAAKDLNQLIHNENMTLSANGSIFDNTVVGIIPEILTVWYQRRQTMKQQAHHFDELGDKVQSEYYNMRQNVAKIGLNSLYGAISNPFSRFYTLDCAKSVTLTGQEIEKFQILVADGCIRGVRNV